MTIVTLILSSGDMSLCPDDRGRPLDDRDKSGTQIDVSVHSDCLCTQSQTGMSCPGPLSGSITGGEIITWVSSLYCIALLKLSVLNVTPLYLPFWHPIYLYRILV